MECMKPPNRASGSPHIVAHSSVIELVEGGITTRDEAQKLLAALPEHLADMAAFSLATGLRRANVTELQWTQVDLVRRIGWVHPDQAKGRRAIAVPLNAEAVVIIRKRLGKHPTHVFSFRG